MQHFSLNHLMVQLTSAAVLLGGASLLVDLVLSFTYSGALIEIVRRDDDAFRGVCGVRGPSEGARLAALSPALPEAGVDVVEKRRDEVGVGDDDCHVAAVNGLDRQERGGAPTGLDQLLVPARNGTCLEPRHPPTVKPASVQAHRELGSGGEAEDGDGGSVSQQSQGGRRGRGILDLSLNLSLDDSSSSLLTERLI